MKSPKVRPFTPGCATPCLRLLVWSVRDGGVWFFGIGVAGALDRLRPEHSDFRLPNCGSYRRLGLSAKSADVHGRARLPLCHPPAPQPLPLRQAGGEANNRRPKRFEALQRVAPLACSWHSNRRSIDGHEHPALPSSRAWFWSHGGAVGKGRDPEGQGKRSCRKLNRTRRVGRAAPGRAWDAGQDFVLSSNGWWIALLPLSPHLGVAGPNRGSKRAHDLPPH